MQARVKLVCADLLALVVPGLSACNTWEGIRKDARAVGDQLNNGKKK